MFTGIVEAVGEVVEVGRRGDVVRIVVDEQALAAAVALGDSVAVNGTCLTIAEADPTRLHFDAIPETMQKTSLGTLAAGSPVNLERAMRAEGSLQLPIAESNRDEE